MKREGPLKVCLVAPYPPPYGGISHWTEMLLAHLEGNQDVQVHLVDISPHWRNMFDLRPWKRMLFAVPSTLVVAAKVLGRILAGCEAIHMTTSGQLALTRDCLVLQIARVFRVPVCYHIRFGRVPEMALAGTWEWRLMARNMARAHTVIAIDKATEETVLRNLPSVRVVRIPNFMDFSKLPAIEPSPEGVKTMVYVGWVIPTKGIEELVQAWSELALPGWRLKIIGPVEPAYRGRLMERYRPQGLSMDGEMPHGAAMQEVANARVFVFPSYTEGFPNAILEAMGMGKAILASAVGAIPEMLEGGGGLTVPPRSVQALKEALGRLAGDPILQADLAWTAREKADQFGLQAVCDRLLACWRDTARPRRVLMVAPVPPPYGGIAHWTRLVTEALAHDPGLRIDLVDSAPYRRHLTEQSRFKRVCLGILRAAPILGRSAWRMLLGSDAVHITTSGQFAILRDLALLRLAGWLGIPTFYHLHFGRIPAMAQGRSREWRWMARALAAAHTVIPIDRATEDALRRWDPGMRVVRLANCIDPLPALPLTEPGQDRIATFMGWVVATKGIEELVQAWQRLAPQGWRLEVLGPWDPPLMRHLKESYSLQGIDFLGSVPHAEAIGILARSEFLVLPSYSEGFPNVVLEAMALGKPVLATRVGAIPELVEEDGGLLVDPHSVPQLEAALSRLMEDDELRRRAGLAMRAKAPLYTVAKACEALVSLWTQDKESR